MNVEVLEKTRNVLYQFLESVGEYDHLWPEGKPWVGTAKIIAREFGLQLLKLFKSQAKEYASRIQERPKGQVKEADDDLTSWLEGLIFTDDDVWQKQLSQMILPYMSKGMETGAIKTAAEYGIGISFDLANPRAQNLILERAIPFARELQETTHNAVRDALATGFEEGESIYQLRERVRDLPEFGKYRSEMVARTEVISACNAGELEAYREMGAAGKKWSAAGDSRTRPWHREAHGQVCYLDEPFNVGGEELQHPGDGGAKNRINCRCTMVPIFDADRVEAERGKGSDWEQRYKDVQAKKEARLAKQRAKQQEHPGYKKRTNKTDQPSPVKDMKPVDDFIDRLDELGIKNYIDIHPDFAEAMLNEINELKEELPIMFDDKLWLRLIETRDDLGATCYGGARNDYIALGQKFFLDPKHTKERILQNEKDLFHPVGCAKYWKAYTLRHELGHVIEDHISFRYPAELAEFRKRHGRLPEALGQYAHSSPSEAFAEAFFAVKYSTDDKMMSTTFMKAFIKLLKVIGWTG